MKDNGLWPETTSVRPTAIMWQNEEGQPFLTEGTYDSSFVNPGWIKFGIPYRLVAVPFPNL